MKIRCVSIDTEIANPSNNLVLMKEKIREAFRDKVDILVFPRLPLTGISLGDVRFNKTFLEENEKAVEELKSFIELEHYNPQRGDYECSSHLQIFFSYLNEQGKEVIYNRGKSPYNVCFNNSYFGLDRDCPIIINLGGEFESVGHFYNKPKEIQHDSKVLRSLIVSCCGKGFQSSSQGVYSNLKVIAADGELLSVGDGDIVEFNYDFEGLINRRRRLGITTDLDLRYENTEYSLMSNTTPYLPRDIPEELLFGKILDMQVDGLYQKMKSMNRFKICLGVSGGLDSTVSLLVCVKCFEKYNLNLKNIIGVTMPGLGTTVKTYTNAMSLMKNLGIKTEEIDLKPLLQTHLKNISQPEGKYDVTYEQCQSRERTQVLLDIANRDNAIMIGTGCMSEFALGWMTYGGDHLSMYAINIGLPKTVVKMYAKWFINLYDPALENPDKELPLADEKSHVIALIVKDILNGPVSPELLPIDEKGEQHEKTESIIGDYMVQDFFIYHMMVNGYSMKKLFNLTCYNFPQYKPAQILKWLDIFAWRFFTRAYKKNCFGDGIKIFDYSVSPDDFWVPSDIDYSIWKKELEDLHCELGVE